MNKKIIILAAAAVVLLIAAMFGYSYYAKRQLAENVPPPAPAEEELETLRIDAVHVFADGSHTVMGEVLVPTACHLVRADAVVRESMPEQVTIALTTIAPSAGVMCAQVLTPQRFRADFDASAEAVISATLDGRAVILNLVERSPEDLDELEEFYFKG